MFRCRGKPMQGGEPHFAMSQAGNPYQLHKILNCSDTMTQECVGGKIIIVTAQSQNRDCRLL